jgi:hypothetical protein
MKNTYFFSHDFGARNDPKLQNVLMECGCEGLGVFWCIVEQMYEQGGNLPLVSCKSIAFALHVDCNVVEHIVKDFYLFQNDGINFWSESINSRLNKRAEITDKRKKAAANRWKSNNDVQLHSKSNAIALQDYAIKGNKRKEKENNNIKEKEKEKGENAQRFTPPSIDEVKNYISEKGYTVDAEAFVSFYTSKNWFVGKNKMKDWRAAIVTWQKRNNEKLENLPQNVNEIWK